jgi:ParB family transcriptional regulator, chromosome partitioning protein
MSPAIAPRVVRYTTTHMNIIPSSFSSAAKAYIESSQALNRTIHTAIHQQTDSLREALKEITEQTPNFTNTISIDQIKLPLSQPRRYFNPKKLEELSSSIKQFGILEPLLVRQKPDGEYELIAGERRRKIDCV